MFAQQSSLLSMVSLMILSIFSSFISKVNSFSAYELGNYIGFTTDRSISYSEASLYCKIKIGTSLATITNEEDNDDAVTVAFATSPHNGKLNNNNNNNNVSPGYLWFGLHDQDNTKKYKFQDGTSYIHGNSFHKFTSSPEHNDEEPHCAALYSEPSDKKWQDFRCDGSEGEVRGFVCNKRKNN